MSPIPAALVLLLLAAGPAAAGRRVPGRRPPARRDPEHPRDTGCRRPALGQAPPGARLRGFGCTADTPSGLTWCRVKAGPILGWARRRYLSPE